MDGKLRNMTSIYLRDGERVLLLYRQGGRVVNDMWVSSAGGHFESFELNDARACVLRELNEELGLCESDIENLSLRYITLRRTKGEIRQNYFFFAEIKSTISRELTSNEGLQGVSRLTRRRLWRCRIPRNLLWSITAKRAERPTRFMWEQRTGTE